MQLKESKFSDRAATSAAAKQALLAKFKPKPMVTAPEPINHEAERQAKIEAIRQQRAEEKAAKQRQREEAAAAAEQARLDAIAAAEQAKLDAEHLSDAQKRAERKARKKEIKELAKMKKELHQMNRPSDEARAERKKAQTDQWGRERTPY
jgi:hypothetical protein